VVVNSNPYGGVVPTTIVHQTMVRGLETSLYGYPKSPWGYDAPVVAKALNVEKCLPLRRGLLNRMNKHYLHAGPLKAGVLLLLLLSIGGHQPNIAAHYQNS